MRVLFYSHGRSVVKGALFWAILLIFNSIPIYAAQVSLEWSQIPSAESYKVYHRVEGGSYNYGNPVWTGMESSSVIDQLADNTTHHFVVRACSGATESPDSNEVSHFAPSPAVLHTISAAAGANGTVSPHGTVSIPQGENQTFNITPNSGYQIADIKVDGIFIGTVDAYTFTQIDANHSIEAHFKAREYVITANSGPGGVISPNGNVSALHNSSQAFYIVPNSGYTIADLIVNGVSKGSATSYTFDRITTNHSIEARFIARQYNVMAIANEGGRISPEGLTTLVHKSSQTYTITPLSGYRLSDVQIDGISQGPIPSYTFNAINKSHTISATFESTTQQASIIVDNGDTGTFTAGTWYESGGTDHFGTRSIYSKQVGADYTFQKNLKGRYQVSMWWSGYNSRCTNVPVEIYDGDMLLDTVYVDQKQNSGHWNALGTYDFTGTASVAVISENSECSTCADAIKLDIDDRLIVIDNDDAGTSSTGAWYVSGGSGSFGAESLYSKEVGAEYIYDSQITGRYDVSLWWSGYKSRCSAVPVGIYDGEKLLRRVSVDQTTQSGEWNSLGTYYFNNSARVVVSSESNQCSTSADALRYIFSEGPDVMDDGDEGTSSAGLWYVSGGTNAYGAQSVYSKKPGSVYTYESRRSGLYEVALWWTGFHSRCSRVPVEIYDGDRFLDRIYIDQTKNSGQWNVLGRYYFTETAKVNILAESTECSTAADALRWSK